jgi:hypothetical protein
MLSAVLWQYTKHNTLLKATLGLLPRKNGKCSLCSAPLSHPQCAHPLYRQWQTENPNRNNCQCASVNRQQWVRQTNNMQLLADELTANVQVSTVSSGWDKQVICSYWQMSGLPMCKCQPSAVGETRNSYWQMSAIFFKSCNICSFFAQPNFPQCIVTLIVWIWPLRAWRWLRRVETCSPSYVIQ